MRPLLLLLLGVLLFLSPSTDSRKSKKKAAHAKRQRQHGGTGSLVLGPWTERPLGWFCVNGALLAGPGRLHTCRGI